MKSTIPTLFNMPHCNQVNDVEVVQIPAVREVLERGMCNCVNVPVRFTPFSGIPPLPSCAIQRFHCIYNYIEILFFLVFSVIVNCYCLFPQRLRIE